MQLNKELVIWFKHSDLFETDYNNKLLRSGYYDPQNKLIGYKYINLYERLIINLYPVYFKLPIDVNTGLPDDVKLSVLLDVDVEDINGLLKALKICGLLLDNELVYAKNWFGERKTQKFVIFYSTVLETLRTANGAVVSAPTKKGNKYSYIKFSNIKPDQLVIAKKFAIEKMKDHKYPIYEEVKKNQKNINNENESL